MLLKLRAWWDEVEGSLWFIPAAITVAAIGLAFLTLHLDYVVIGQQGGQLFVTFGGGPDAARNLLSTIAGSMITVTGVVFSITIVALQLASTQLSPRVLRNFMADRANQTVLGIFIGTFSYSLMVLRAVRSSGFDGPAFVPALSVSVALVLVLVSMAFLIYFIDHTARSIQASTVITRVTKDTLHQIGVMFPAQLGHEADADGEKPTLPEGTPADVTVDESGYLQGVDENTILNLANEGRLTVHMEPLMGEFLLPGQLLARVWPASAADDDLVGKIRRAFQLEQERSIREANDPEFGIRQLADIAMKALSPGINDPTTAIICIDRLAQVIVTLGNRALPSRVRRDDSGRLLFFARRVNFEHAMHLSFDQIRQYGAGTPYVLSHLLDTLGRTYLLVPPARRAAVAREAAWTLDTARRSVSDPADLAGVMQAGAWLDRYAVRHAYSQDENVA
ncbi:MAG: DUF2254 domain-containing protein [Chloroflexota bacterium]